ncbi:hypothetical protein EBB07_14620 [Paenibacillaceae bacterium]|nr:hypothetical protein EBB07_14620 [Paenibacillaceae bacterium]
MNYSGAMTQHVVKSELLNATFGKPPIGSAVYLPQQKSWEASQPITDLALGFGHTSLILQNAKGDWSYFYYGDKSVEFVKVDSSALSSLKSFNEWGIKKAYLDLEERWVTSFLLIFKVTLRNHIPLLTIWQKHM